MALSLEDAIARFPTLGGGQRATISMKVFTSPEHMAAYVVEVCQMTGHGIDASGHLTAVADADLDTYSARFLAACEAAGDEVPKALATDSKGLLERSQRYESIVRAAYRLGFALDEDGELVG